MDLEDSSLVIKWRHTRPINDKTYTEYRQNGMFNGTWSLSPDRKEARVEVYQGAPIMEMRLEDSINHLVDLAGCMPPAYISLEGRKWGRAVTPYTIESLVLSTNEGGYSAEEFKIVFQAPSETKFGFLASLVKKGFTAYAPRGEAPDDLHLRSGHSPRKGIFLDIRGIYRNTEICLHSTAFSSRLAEVISFLHSPIERYDLNLKLKKKGTKE